MQQLLGVDNTSALLITLIFVTGYVFIGGTYAHVFTNLLQGILMIVVAFIVVASGLPLLFADWPGFVAAMEAQNPLLLAPVNTEGRLFNDVFSTYLAGFFVGAAVVCQPHILTKALYVKSDKDVRRYLQVAGVVLALFFMLGTVGFYARIAVPPEQLIDAATGAFRQDLVMTMYLKNAFPDWVFTLISVVLLAAAMSTLDGLLVGLSTITANDLLLNLVKRVSPTMNQQAQLAWAYKASHIVLVVIAVAAFLVLQNPPKLLGVFGQLGIFGLVLAAVPPLLAGVLLKQVSVLWVFTGSVAAMACHFVLYFFGAQLFPESQLSFANPAVTMALAMLFVALPSVLIAACWRCTAGWRKTALSVSSVATALLLGTVLSSPADAKEQVWPSNAQVRDAQGRLLFTEHWLSVYADGELSQWNIYYQSPQGHALGQRSLSFEAQRPYQPLVDLQLRSGEWLRLDFEQRRWVRQIKQTKGLRTQKTWPDIRPSSIVDLALLRYVVEQREQFRQQAEQELSWFSPELGRSQGYRVKSQLRAGRYGEQLLLRLISNAWFGSRQVVWEIALDAESGQLRYLRRRATQWPLMDVSQMPINVEFDY